jgi:tetratricopeptide (TPR) repeat protein
MNREMRARWFLVVSLTVWACSGHGQGLTPPGRYNPPMGMPITSQPASSASPARTRGNATQGILLDLESNLGRGIGAELTQQYKEAVKLLTHAIEEEHGDVFKLGLAHRFRGLAYKHLGRRDDALADFLEVIRIQPRLDLGYYDAGVIYNLTNRYKEAVDAMTRAIDLRRDDRGLARRRSERGNAYFHLGQFKRAQEDFVAAVRLDPREPDVLNNAAWFRATCPDASFRNGKEAVELASRACQLDKWKDADEIDTLAAAHAEAGNFAEAERYQLKALSLLSADEALRPKFKARLETYRAKQAIRQQIGER